MRNVVNTIKEKMARIARREIKKSIPRSRTETTAFRRGLTGLKCRRVPAGKALSTRAKPLRNLKESSGSESRSKAWPVWFSSDGIRSLRQRKTTVTLSGIRSPGAREARARLAVPPPLPTQRGPDSRVHNSIS